ncbi:MAG TPA: hypothetical protein PK698_01680 [Bacilli bacterium]|nr:hypothetical protein [Bacilli bacterium]
MVVRKLVLSLYNIASHLVINLNRITMKKLIVVLCLIGVSHICAAPDFSGEQKKKQMEMSLYNFYLSEYEKEFDEFMNHLGFKESGNDWTTVNSYNYLGEFQFGQSALERVGFGHITPEAFRKDPSIFPRELQIEALKALIMCNELDLNRKISKYSDVRYVDYIGQIVNGIYITKGGLLAGMHLGGLGGIKIFLLSDGKVDLQDGYGTKVSDYIKEFSIYNLSRNYLKIIEYINDPNKYLLDDDKMMMDLLN